MDNPIQLYLCTIRNAFSRGVVASETREELQQLAQTPVQRFPRVLKWGVETATALFETDPETAGHALNVIHNLPFDGGKWPLAKRRYFFEVELPTFLERTTGLTILAGLFSALGDDLSQCKPDHTVG